MYAKNVHSSLEHGVSTSYKKCYTCNKYWEIDVYNCLLVFCVVFYTRWNKRYFRPVKIKTYAICDHQFNNCNRQYMYK